MCTRSSRHCIRMPGCIKRECFCKYAYKTQHTKSRMPPCLDSCNALPGNETAEEEKPFRGFQYRILQGILPRDCPTIVDIKNIGYNQSHVLQRLFQRPPHHQHENL